MIKNNSFPLLFLFSIAFFLLCILGTWQLNKEYNTNKNNKIINHNLTEKPKNILFINDKLPKLTYGIVNGQVIDNKTIFLEPRTYKGKVGYHEIAVFKVINKYILINRGFTNKKIKNQNLKRKITIEGLLMKIEKPKFFEIKNDIINNTWYTLNLPDIQKNFDLKLEPFIIYEQNIEGKSRKPVLPNIISNVNHLNYAFTWYFLALSLSIIFCIYFRKNC